MSDLRIETLTMPAASLGPENPLPMLRPRLSATAGDEFHDSVLREDRQHFGYGLDAGWLPHRGLDDYDRNRVDRTFLALVLENEFLRATFLPEIGGRLWSLVHKPTGRELLHVNPVFQPANLAIRGAWVAGGVEWNAAVFGHSPYNCSSLFAALVEDHHAGKVLRLYEWDRTRCAPYQLDVSLPAASPFLFVRVRLANPHAQTIPMYWWSNIAVPESPDVRILAPADRAYTYEYGGPIHVVPIPKNGDLDVTYSTNIPHAADYFFRIANDERPWIAALDRDGRGLVQTSTARQVGRKLFAWGANPGGRRWQRFLSAEDHPYLEIQAGIARTQMECLPMPAGAQWEWTEAYGFMEADPSKVHGADWCAAVGDVAERLECALPRPALEAQLNASAAHADLPPLQILHRGSGWGALERHRREETGEPPFCSGGLIFDDASLGEDQAPWLNLLEHGWMPERDPAEEPGAWMVQSEWRTILEGSSHHRCADHWLTHLHLGLMYFSDSDFSSAERAWQQSLRRHPSGWAYRDLAMLCALNGRTREALSLYQQAHVRLPDLRTLLVEYCEALLDAGLAPEAMALIESSSESIRRHSRVQMLQAKAGQAIGLPDCCGAILQKGYELVDVREGETSITDLWTRLQARERNASIHQTSAATSAKSCDSAASIPSHLDFQITNASQLQPTAIAREKVSKVET